MYALVNSYYEYERASEGLQAVWLAADRLEASLVPLAERAAISAMTADAIVDLDAALESGALTLPAYEAAMFELAERVTLATHFAIHGTRKAVR